MQAQNDDSSCSSRDEDFEQQLIRQKVKEGKRSLNFVFEFMSKCYYKRRSLDLIELFSLNFKLLAQQINGLSIDQQELYHEVQQLSQENEINITLEAIFEESYLLEQDSDRNLECFGHIQEKFEEFQRALQTLQEGQNKIIDLYKLELQNMAREISQEVKKNEELKKNKEKQKQKIDSLEDQLENERKQKEEKINQILIQNLNQRNEDWETRIKDLGKELTSQRAENQFLQDRIKQINEEMKIKQLKLQQYEKNQIENIEILNQKQNKKEQKAESMEKEIARLQAIIIRKERNHAENQQKFDQMVREKDEEIQMFKENILQLKQRNDLLTQNFSSTNEFLQKQVIKQEREIDELNNILANQETKYQDKLQEEKQNFNSKLENEQKQAMEYLSLKEQEIQALKNKIKLLQSKNQETNLIEKKHNFQENYQDSERLKDLQNFMFLLSKELKEKEIENQLLLTENQNLLSKLQENKKSNKQSNSLNQSFQKYKI